MGKEKRKKKERKGRKENGRKVKRERDFRRWKRGLWKVFNYEYGRRKEEFIWEG